MTLNLCVLTPNRIVWDSEVKEIIFIASLRFFFNGCRRRSNIVSGGSAADTISLQSHSPPLSPVFLHRKITSNFLRRSYGSPEKGEQI
jgi:hypothetical protein